jgi:hypothetical protein
VGKAYLAHVRRAVHKRTFDEDEADEARRRSERLNGDADGANGENDLGVGDEEEGFDLLLLDPKEWKVCVLCFDVGTGVAADGMNRNKIITRCWGCRI